MYLCEKGIIFPEVPKNRARTMAKVRGRQLWVYSTEEFNNSSCPALKQITLLAWYHAK